jgi:hypothetical protein
MPEKASVPAKKPGTAKPNAKNRFSRGDSAVCAVCGLSVVVEEVAGIVVGQESALLCCGKPMKARKAPQKAKAAKPIKSDTLSGWPQTQAAGSSGLVADPKEDTNQQ